MSAAGFLKLPDALLYDPDVSDGAVRAYAVLARYATSCSSDTFEMTGDQLATLQGVSRRQSDRRLEELRRLALVVIDGNRGRGRPNRITVLDPQGVVFAGLHVERAWTSMSKPASPDVSKPASPDVSKPYREGREDESGQRSKRSATTPPMPRPVDNGGAARLPSTSTRAAPAECPDHRGQPAHNCGPCRSEQLEQRGPRF